MKKEIKQEILSTAKTLFNEYGYNQVSMRTIADRLGISVGNLTYHYKKKEDLVEAVVLEQHTAYRKFKVPTNLKELDGFFRHMINHQDKNDYYFRHYAQLAQLSPRVYAIQRSVVQDKKNTLLEAFGTLTTDDILLRDHITGQTALLTDAIMFLSTYGISMNAQNRLRCLWSLIYPLLTEKGQALYHQAIEPHLPEYDT